MHNTKRNVIIQEINSENGNLKHDKNILPTDTKTLGKWSNRTHKFPKHMGKYIH